MLGASIFSASIYFAQYMATFSGFLCVYAFSAGVGIGIIWVLPVACAWSYFPEYRAPVAGSIFSWLGISTIFWSHIANHTVNPTGEAGTIVHDSGRGIEVYFAPDSPQVKALPSLCKEFAVLSLLIMMFGVPFLTYNYKEAARKCTTAYMEIKQHLPYLTPEERNKKDLKRYGVLASKAIKSKDVLEAIQEQEKIHDQQLVDHHIQNRAIIEASKQFISRENH